MALLPIQNNLVLELHVPSFQPERDFYKLFGFEELTYDPTSGGGSDLGYMVLIRHDAIGDTLINFYGDKPKVTEHARFNEFPADTPRGYAVEITAVVSDVEGLWKAVKDKLVGDAISQPLTLKRWGKRDFRVIDPFGFYVRFTELVDWGQAAAPAMRLYRFSPIKDEAMLQEALAYVHTACHELCKKVLGEYLPIAGNIGIFCHYEDEFAYLTKVREERTDAAHNWNQKYFQLHQPLTFQSHNDVPEATYTYLYVRRPDPYRHHVGDADFVLDKQKFDALKKSLLAGKNIPGARVFHNPELDLIELYDPDFDVCSYINTKTIDQEVQE